MRVITLGLFDYAFLTRRSALKINFAFFFALKRDPPRFFFTRLSSTFVEVVQLFNMLHQRRILFTQILIARSICQTFGIGQTRMELITAS